MVFYTAFNSIKVISRRQVTLFMLSWVSPVLGLALKCLAQGHSHKKKPEDLVKLDPRTPGLRVKHFTTEPRVTQQYKRLGVKVKTLITTCIIFFFPYNTCSISYQSTLQATHHPIHFTRFSFFLLPSYPIPTRHLPSQNPPV